MRIADAIAALCLSCLAGGLHQFGINGGAVLCVPDRDLNSDILPYAQESLHLQIGNGHVPGVPFLFEASDMRRRIPGYYVDPRLESLLPVSSFNGSVDFVDDPDRKRYGPAMRAAYLKEIWYARAPCTARVVEPVPGTTLARAKCDDSYEDGLLLSRAPDRHVSLPDPNTLVVASCHYEVLKVGPYAGNELRNCARTVIIDGFLADYSFQEPNARFIPEFDRFLADKIAEWRNNCHATDRL